MAKSGLRTKMVTSVFRVSYPKLSKADSFGGEGKKNFSVVALFDKEKSMTGQDKDGALKFSELIKNAKIEAWGTDEKKWPKNMKDPTFKDGDGEDGQNADGVAKKGYAGHRFTTFKTGEDYPPEVFDNDKSRLEIDQIDAVVYPGCYARAVIKARAWSFPQDKPSSWGVSLILDGVHKVKEGEPFGDRQSSRDLFDSVETEEDLEEVPF